MGKHEKCTNGWGFKNISDLILKETYGKYENNFSEDELNTKSNKEVYVKNDVMTTVIKRCRGERKIVLFRKKLMIPEPEILECSEYDVKSKMGNIFINEKILEEYCVKIYDIDLYFYEHSRELINKSWRKWT